MILDKRVLIYGSCVSRDTFSNVLKKIKISDYYARTSLISLNTLPIEYKPEEINLTSNFQKRLLERDFTKDFFTRIGKKDFEFIVIDFIDERFNLLSNGTSVITKSSELVNSGFLKNRNDEFKEFNRFAIDLELWQSACNSFLGELTKIVKTKQIILLKALWADKYYSKDGTIKYFEPPKYLDQIQKNNNLLSTYYDYFVTQCPGCKVISSGDIIAYENHQWGLSPFHYIPEWYEKVGWELNNIFNDTGN